MKRAILFTAITALILGLSGLRPAEAAGALNHGPRLTVKIAKPGLVQKAHHRSYSRGRDYRFSRSRSYRKFSPGRSYRKFNPGRSYRKFNPGRSYRRFSPGRSYYRRFSGAVVTRGYRNRWPGYGGRQFSQRRNHR
ncbi:MAG: hypothetical protein IIA68_09585 [Proteobacteria bacterium]|nr:hypothetical protein [Pseudomonadota bacterium]